MFVKIGCIVEGEGDKQALPILIRRLAANVDLALIIHSEIRRVSKSQLMRESELERTLEALSRQIGRSSPILVLLDADQDCPVSLADGLLRRSKIAHRDLRVSVVVAKCEYEAWFLAAATSLSGCGGLPDNLAPPADPEGIRGAKQWLTSRMEPASIYVETKHQAAFTAKLDLETAKQSRSFRKCEKEVRRLLLTSHVISRRSI